MTEAVVDEVRSALREEEGVGPRQASGVRVFLDHGDLVLEGEVSDVAAKKLALERAAAIRGVDRIIDRLHVHPDQPRDDAWIAERVGRSLMEESSLSPFAIRWRVGARCEELRSEGSRGEMEIRVEEGVVTLDGDVSGLGHKRLAGSLAWWVTGVRDVVNGLGVTPPEPDTDGEIDDAVRMALEKDPLVDAAHLTVSCRAAVVTLDGALPSEEQRLIAERDAWAVFGVDRVINLLRVEPLH